VRREMKSGAQPAPPDAATTATTAGRRVVPLRPRRLRVG